MATKRNNQTNQTKSLQLNVRITPETRRQIANLCLSLDKSESELIRLLVADIYAKFNEASAEEIKKIQKGVRKAILGLHVVK